MKKTITKLLALSLLASGIAHADYRIHINTEQSNGGQLPNGSISFVDKSSGDGNGNGPTQPTEPSVPTEPNTPEEPQAPQPERKLVATLNFTPLYGQGEPNLLTENNLNVFVIQTSTFAIKGALEHDKNYYITNNGNECKYIADVCTMNVDCVYSRSGLTGSYTMLSISPSEAASCLTFEIRNFDKKYLKNVTIYDNPITE